MKHIALASAFLLATICGTLIAQNPVQFQPTTIDPTGRACNSTQGNLRTPSGTLYTCQNGLMAKASNAGGGGPPSGKAGGDLSGSYPNPSVAKINGANPPISAGVVGTNASRQIVAVPGTPSDCVHVDGSSSACSPSGAVIGPASAIDSSIVLYDGTTGKLVKAGSGCTIASGVITCTSFNSNDTSHSGVSIYNGLTSGTVALGAADIAGTAIVYVLPSTNGTANQVLTDSGSTTCPTFAAGAPATCHLLAWVTASSLSGLTPSSRSISTTSPITGGGDLSADRTIGLSLTTTACTAPAFVNAISSSGIGTCVTPVLTQNSQSAAYTTVLGDAGKMILHPSTDNNARTFTIDSNANVAYPTGTCITFVDMINTVTIAITSDTMTLMGANTTGSRTLAVGNWATACKIGSTSWVIGGSSGLT